MPGAFVPPGYRAVLIGQARNTADLGTFIPQEESSAEGTPVLVKLGFAAIPSDETLADLERACFDAGVEPFPGSPGYVYAETASNTVYMVWQKGMPWLPIIIGILATTVLPPLLTAGIWLILPGSLKSLLSGLVDIGMLLMMMWLMTTLLKPVTASSKKKAKEIEATNS